MYLGEGEAKKITFPLGRKRLSGRNFTSEKKPGNRGASLSTKRKINEKILRQIPFALYTQFFMAGVA